MLYYILLYALCLYIYISYKSNRKWIGQINKYEKNFNYHFIKIHSSIYIALSKIKNHGFGFSFDPLWCAYQISDRRNKTPNISMWEDQGDQRKNYFFSSSSSSTRQAPLTGGGTSHKRNSIGPSSWWCWSVIFIVVGVGTWQTRTSPNLEVNNSK